ncbi:MAG: phenylacetate--CoA ligase family protein, partial [Verrucomicrobiota bacterium]
MADDKNLERTAISAGQLDQLRALLAVILPANGFYTRKLSGIQTEFATLEEFCEKTPLTTKEELMADQEASPPFGTNLTFPLENYTRFHQTSGTTGTPLRWLDTPGSWQSMVENWVEIFRVAGVGAGDKIYFAFSFGPFLGFWLAFDAAQQIGALCVPGGGLSSEGRLKAILENEITVLC